PVWTPYVRGERAPFHDPGLRAGLHDLDITHDAQAVERAAYEASGFVVRHIVELASASGTRPKRFVVSGGGSRRPAWLQAIADVLGQAVVPMAVPEGAALGAAFLARMSLGLETSMEDAVRWARWSAPVEPAPAWATAVDDRYQRWLIELPAR
ncbi:MAG TPA: FGGY-family carbohydrate kinase, partial [Acidimicrobiales bacterium]|nr:FGGY-family carbohydrate kinase [Acidimicrobiales bacterium]